MESLQLTEHIKTQLSGIIDHAINQNMIDTEELRMIILTPNSTFDLLHVYYYNEWEEYYDHYENRGKAPLGDIDISQWLNIADQAFEERDQLDGQYSKLAKQHKGKHQPALHFNHIPEGNYKNYLIYLRGQLIDQINEAISTLATTKYAGSFNYLVGFVTYKLEYDDNHGSELIAFTHKHGAGPFYNVMLTLPDIKLTYPYLKFHESGFTLFYPQGNKIDDDIEEESNVYTFDIHDLRYACFPPQDRDEVVFRLKEEFEDWKLGGGHINDEKGDLSEKDFFNAFRAFLQKYPDINPQIDYVPDPLKEESAFDKWLAHFIENNLQMSYEHKQQLVKYGDDAVKKVLDLIPNTHLDSQSIKRIWAGEYFNSGNYERSAEILESVKKLSDHYKIHLLQVYYFLGNRNKFESTYSGIEAKRSKSDALFMQWLFDIKEHASDIEKIHEIERDLLDFVEEKSGYYVESNGWFALTRVYIQLGEESKAIEAFKSIDLDYLNLYELARKEFGDTEFILNEIAAYDDREAHKKEVDRWIDENALNIPEEEPVKFKKAKYDHCFSLEKEIKDADLKWARPIADNTFIGYTQEEIYLAELNSEFILDKKSVVQVDEKVSYSLSYHEDTLYVVCNENITTYSVQDNTLEKEKIIFNQNSKNKYKSATVKGSLLFACNDEDLEIFDLSKSLTEPIVECFYIDYASWMHVHNNNLIINRGPDILIVDISNITKPKILSAIKGIVTINNGEIFIHDDHLICSHIINIQDPNKPVYVGTTGEEVALVYSFSKDLPANVYATGDEYLLKQFNPEGKDLTANWIECLDQEKDYLQRIVYNLAVSYQEDRIITFSKYDITVFRKSAHPGTRFDVHDPVRRMVMDTMKMLAEKHPDFLIGKVKMKHDPYTIDLEFHYCSSMSVLEGIYDSDRGQQIFRTNLDPKEYIEKELKAEYKPEFIVLDFDEYKIIDELINDPRFNKQAAKHVALITNNHTRWISFEDHQWDPYRSAIVAQEQGNSVLSVLSGKNENLIDDLKEKVSTDQTILNELLDIINYQLQPSGKSSDTTIVDGEINSSGFPDYVRLPKMSPDQEDNGKKITAELKQMALNIVCHHHDRELVKNILLNGAKYGIPMPSFKTEPDQNPEWRFLEIFAYNTWNVLKEFGEDEEVKSFLTDVLDQEIDVEIAARLAIHYQAWDHPFIQKLIEKKLIENGFPFHEYKNSSSFRGIDFSSLPVDIFMPFKERFLDTYQQYIENDDEQLDWTVKNGIVTLIAVLVRMGHQEVLDFPEKIQKRIDEVKERDEKYEDDWLDEDEDWEDENTFLLKLQREMVAKKIIGSFMEEADEPVWLAEWKPEPYRKSWYNMFDILLRKGEKEMGEHFKDQLLGRLSQNISKGDEYQNDRIMAFNFVPYVFKNIIEQPELATLVAPLIDKISENSELFEEDLDLSAVKEKVKFTLLQDAWNDFSAGDVESAEKKCEGVLSIDEEFGQAYFLKARLMWKNEGMDVYLENRDHFIEKASHDPVALGRLYNMTGCVLDLKNQYEEALSYFKKAVQTSPNDVLLYANIAEMYYKMKNPEKAIYYANKTKEKGGVSDMADEILRNKGVMSDK